MLNKYSSGLKRREAIEGYLFLLPWLIGFALFTVFPFFFSLKLSFSEVAISPTEGIKTDFIGFKWYKEALTSDPTYTLSLLDSLKFIVLSTPMIVVCALLLAILLNGSYRGRTFFRALFFFPVVIISGPVVTQLLDTDAAAVINPQNFAVYTFISELPGFLSTPLIYIFENIVLMLWFSGVQVIFFLAGLQKIGLPIREAASIDGASKWQMFWKIYLPYLKPLILINSLYTVVLLSGFSTNKVNGEIETKMHITGKTYGYSSAMAWMYFMILAVILLLVFLVLKPHERRPKE